MRKGLAYLSEYFHSIYGSWVSLVSGVGSIVSLALLAFWGDDWPFLKDNKKTFVWLSIICVVVTAFVVWFKERRALEAEQAKNTRPEITGEIGEVLVEHSLNTHRIPTFYECFFTVQLLVRNKRAATTIERYKLTLIADGQYYDANNQPADGYQIERRYKHLVGFEPSTEIRFETLKDLEKDKATLLATGEHREGWLRFYVAIPEDGTLSLNLPEEFEKKAEIFLTVIDGFGESHPPIGRKAPFDTWTNIRRIPKSRNYTTRRIEQ